MDATRFDAVARLFANRRTRRRALAEVGAGLAAGALAAAGLTARAAARDEEAAAQDADAAHDSAMLFLQAFRAGAVAPKDGAPGRYVLTLEQGLGQTVYFSDRPERLVGTSPTPRFQEGLGFPEDNPPNAALVVTGADGETQVAVVELFEPAYDEATHTATYEVAVLEAWEDELGVGFTEEPTDLSEFGSSFGAAHLFIDDCNDLVACRKNFLEYIGDAVRDDGTTGPIGQCWNGNIFDSMYGCRPDNSPCNGQTRDHYSALCNQHYGSRCDGQCAVY